jgi:squalene-hopene/tetraprenyl-beta-curcumene cyclase
MIDRERLARCLQVAREELLARRLPSGHWEGRLSSSALATATALTALSLAADPDDEALRAGAVAWLAGDQQPDGGWGDTPVSASNLSTTLLGLSALILAGHAPAVTLDRAWAYVRRHAGPYPADIVAALRRTYGADRTFAVPILMNCALARLVPWAAVPPLPCELAAVPAGLYRLLRLQVVSYALPALIAVGLALDHHHPTWLSPLRRALTPLLLRKLGTLQPAHGGFLEATPLTAFTAMSLISACGPEQPVAARCLGFLRQSVRADGSWPIDTNLATWVTTTAAHALLQSEPLTDRGRALPSPTAPDYLPAVCAWLTGQQFRTVHPYTGAAPGGFGWTDLPGSVPDGDDTAGALLLLATAAERGLPVDPTVVQAATRWLLDLQNADGGWPTFCRGWGKLPFDQSCPDITAHALRALEAVGEGNSPAARRGHAYLRRTQREDGAWLPLWFGNESAPGKANPVLGTSRVLLALPATDLRDRGVAYLLAAQGPDGGFGGDRGLTPTVEETALALGALATEWEGRLAPTRSPTPGEVGAGCPSHPAEGAVAEAVARAFGWLATRLEDGTWTTPYPLGLYFAQLWYYEDLYPVAWTVEALGRVSQALE